MGWMDIWIGEPPSEVTRTVRFLRSIENANMIVGSECFITLKIKGLLALCAQQVLFPSHSVDYMYNSRLTALLFLAVVIFMGASALPARPVAGGLLGMSPCDWPI